MKGGREIHVYFIYCLCLSVWTLSLHFSAPHFLTNITCPRFSLLHLFSAKHLLVASMSCNTFMHRVSIYTLTHTIAINVDIILFIIFFKIFYFEIY